jgi:hypothetical protein
MRRATLLQYELDWEPVCGLRTSLATSLKLRQRVHMHHEFKTPSKRPHVV